MNNKKAHAPIFIHSLFRTGSTYIWNKFRQNDNYYCYYEPLHQNLAGARPDNLEFLLAKDFKSVNHPMLSNFYWYEYRDLFDKESQTLPYFKKSFSFDEFCHNEENPDLKKYIDYLIKHANGKTPVLQFNRSALRIRWFKTAYPDSINIYIVRAPQDQWESYHTIFKQTNGKVFFVMDLLTASLNQTTDCFRKLAEGIPLLEFHHTRFSREEEVYRNLLDCYSDKEQYFIFYYIWFHALLENVLNGDFILNIHSLSQSASYRDRVRDFLNGSGNDCVEFTDAQIRNYSRYSLSSRVRQSIENQVQKDILNGISQTRLERFFDNLPEEDQKFFDFSIEAFRKKKMSRTRFPNIHQKRMEKFNRILQHLEETHYREKTEKVKQISNMSDQIRDIQGQVGILNENLKRCQQDKQGKQETIERLGENYSEKISRLEADRDFRQKLLHEQSKQCCEKLLKLKAQHENTLNQWERQEKDYTASISQLKDQQEALRKSLQQKEVEFLEEKKKWEAQQEANTRLIARQEKELSRLETLLDSQRKTSMQKMAEQKKDFLKQIDLLKKEVSENIGSIDSLQEGLNQAEEERLEATEKLTALSREAEELRQQLDRICNSISWKITKPLRWISSSNGKRGNK